VDESKGCGATSSVEGAVVTGQSGEARRRTGGKGAETARRLYLPPSSARGQGCNCGGADVGDGSVVLEMMNQEVGAPSRRDPEGTVLGLRLRLFCR